MSPAPLAFILFTDDHPRGVAACFGGEPPDWAGVYSPLLSGNERALLMQRVAQGTKSLCVFFHRNTMASDVIQGFAQDMRERGRIIGLDAAQLSGLGQWLAKNDRRAGEPVATLIASGASAVSVSQRDEASGAHRSAQPAFASNERSEALKGESQGGN